MKTEVQIKRGSRERDSPLHKLAHQKKDDSHFEGAVEYSQARIDTSCEFLQNAPANGINCESFTDN